MLFAIGSAFARGDDFGARIKTSSDFAVLKDAQIANEAKVSAGKLRLIVTKTLGSLKQTVDGSVEWNGRSSHVEGKETILGEHEGRQINQTNAFELVYNDTQLISHTGGARSAQITAVDQGHYGLTKLRPVDWWFGKVDGEGSNWSAKFSNMLTLSDALVRTYSLRKLPSGNLLLARSETDALGFKLELSAADDFNAVEYHSWDKTTGFADTRRYVWGRTAHNILYLQRCEITRGHERDAWPTRHVYETLYFDPDYRPSPKRFTLASIPLEPNSVVMNWMEKKRQRVGAVALTEDPAFLKRLDSLAERVRTTGFAARGRKER